MTLEPLYRVEFSYPEHYEIGGPDVGGVFLAEGRCEGALSGRFRGLNHPRLRPDNVYLPDFQGVIETDDGAKVAFDYRGYGRARDYGREIVGTAFHSTGDERYARLNDAVAVLSGEAREPPNQARGRGARLGTHQRRANHFGFAMSPGRVYTAARAKPHGL